MEQHPVPQQISSYHFRLIGDMTIKQFLELIAGIIVAWIIYSLPVSSIIRWPLIIFSVFLGVAFAFLPLEERPLDRWLVAFIKAIYSPTKFVWRKQTIMPRFFETVKIKKYEETETEQSDRKKLKAYLETLPSLGPQTNLDNKENHFVSDIMKMYTEVQPTHITKVKPQRQVAEDLEQAADVKVKVRKLKSPPLNPKAIMRGEVILPKRSRAGLKKLDMPIAEPLNIVKAEKIPVPPVIIANGQNEEDKQYDIGKLSPTGVIKIDREPYKTTQATIKPKLPIPTPPITPNVLVGMVVDKLGSIVEGAILTIRDQDNNVARALKTNKLGQFFIATPLTSGMYEIEVEHEGQSFDIIKIDLVGNLVPPIEIKAT